MKYKRQCVVSDDLKGIIQELNAELEMEAQARNDWGEDYAKMKTR